MTKWLPRTIPIVVSQPKNFFIDDELIGWLSHKNYIFELKSDHYDFIVVNPSHLGKITINEFFILFFELILIQRLTKYFHYKFTTREQN